MCLSIYLFFVVVFVFILHMSFEKMYYTCLFILLYVIIIISIDYKVEHYRWRTLSCQLGPRSHGSTYLYTLAVTPHIKWIFVDVTELWGHQADVGLSVEAGYTRIRIICKSNVWLFAF